jgi:DNA-binding transcriptional MerR regulator
VTEAAWTIDQLAARVDAALSVGYAGQPSARVREVPDPRAIRYYTTLGLLDRPAALRGRTALYGRRHLLQLVAVKRLQAEGLSLAAVQERLAGAPDEVLHRIAQLPPDLEPVPAAAPPPTARPAARFWTASARPARVAAFAPSEAAGPAAAPEAASAAPAPTAALSAPEAAGSAAAPAVTPVVAFQGVPLGTALLLVPATRPLAADDLDAIRRAAQPVLGTLHARGLLHPGQPRPIDQEE